MAKVMGTINQIAFPAIARQQEDLERVRNSVLKSIGLIALVAFPMLWGISAVAPELVRVLLGDKWLPAIPALALLPLVVPIRMIGSVLFTTTLALGNRQLDLRNTIISSVMLPLGFLIGAQWGLIGLCLSWLVTVPLSYAVSISGVIKTIGIRPAEFARECGAPLLAAIGMYGVVAGARVLLPDLPAFVELAALSTAGGLAYFVLIALMSRRHLLTAQSFARSLLGKPDAAPKALQS